MNVWTREIIILFVNELYGTALLTDLISGYFLRLDRAES